MKDQLQHWNNAHAKQWLRAHSQRQTAFAEETNHIIPKKSAILELGCGEGNDSIYFANQGHHVEATDFSDVAIEQSRKRWLNPRLHFAVQDTSKPLNYKAKSFDVVYARLSLHYFTNKVTREIFAEIDRVLKPGGLLIFMCKEVSDPIYGQGTEIESNMFELDGHVRHFFSKPYVEKLLQQVQFTPQSIVTGKEQIYDRVSAFIKVVAEKPE